ncbi:MAG TPA: tetratricopeptide repeat protein [Draconibacterium sp.]|nr:tetratricopeptide repeat protein [Draconibacterium sp.]
MTSTFKYFGSKSFLTELFDPSANNKRKQIYHLLMVIISVFYFISMLSVTKDYGVSGDEVNSHEQAVRVFNYFANGDSTAYENTPGYLNLYGLSANVIAEFISQKIFPSVDLYTTRHYFNICVAFIGTIYIGLIGLRLFGGLGGLISLIFMILSPRYFGHSFNNLLDVPFAVGYIVSIYYIIRFFDTWPKIKIKHAIGLILGTSFAISNRVPGVMLYAYFLFYAFIFYVAYIGRKEFWKIWKFRSDILRFSMWAVGIVIISYGMSLLIWPYGLRNPFMAIPNVLEHFSKIPVNMTTIFDGVQDLSNKMSRYYAPIYLLIGTPLFIAIGILIYIVLLPFKASKLSPAMIFILFTAIFPVAYIVYKNANLYSGMRHLLFIVPSFVLVATAGWVAIVNKFQKSYKLIPLSLLFILFMLPLRHMIVNHPNQYVYFNELIGGMKGGYANYDMDYFYNSIKSGSDWLMENEDMKDDSIIVITNASYAGYFDGQHNVKMNYCRYYDTSKEDWDYAIYSNVFIRREQLLNKRFPPVGTIHTIDVDGYPVAVVFKRISKEDLAGFEALKSNKNEEAKAHFKNYLKLNPYSEQVLEGYANVMLKERKLDSTIIYADSALVYNPDQIGALLLKSSALNTKKEYQSALKTANAMIDFKEDFAEGHYQKGFALKNLNQPNEALKEFQRAITYKKDYNQAFFQMGEILTNYKNYKKAIEIYDKLLAAEPNDFYAKVYKAKTLQLSGDNNQAEKIILALPAANQNNLEVIKVKCRIALSKNDYRTAANYLNMARFINSDADLFVLRAKFALVQNNKQQAEAYLKKANELDPINREAQELLKLFQTSPVVSTEQNTAKSQDQQQQSIMYQKPEPKKTNPLTRTRK